MVSLHSHFLLRVIYAHVTSKSKDAGKRAEAILLRLLSFYDENKKGSRLDFKPFLHLIRYYGMNIDGAPDAPYRAEYILNVALSRIKDGSIEVKVPVIAILEVIQAYSGSNHPDAGQNAERLLKLGYRLEQEGILDEPVNTALIGGVIRAWKNSKDCDKGRRAEHHMKSMIEAYEAGNKMMRPTGWTLYV